jgi:hypothetical protein
VVAPEPDASASPETDDEQSEPPSTEVGADEPREESIDDRDTKEPERVDEDSTANGDIGPVPAELMAAITDDMSSRTGASSQEFEVVRAEAVTWSDGSLGCAKPGETYTMALVDGYWIEIAHGDDIHDYRASDKGYFKYCEGGTGPINPNA